MHEFEHAQHAAAAWLHDVAAELGTGDEHFAYRVLRAWLRTVRDRLPVDGVAHFSAQLPLLLRGVFFDGWVPSAVPVRTDAARFAEEYRREARIALADVRRVAPAVSAALARRCSPGQLEHVLAQLPRPVRELIEPHRAEDEHRLSARR